MQIQFLKGSMKRAQLKIFIKRETASMNAKDQLSPSGKKKKTAFKKKKKREPGDINSQLKYL